MTYRAADEEPAEEASFGAPRIARSALDHVHRHFDDLTARVRASAPASFNPTANCRAARIGPTGCSRVLERAGRAVKSHPQPPAVRRLR